MPVNNDPREVLGYEAFGYENLDYKIVIKNKSGYSYNCRYIKNPTGNCQLASIQCMSNLMPAINKYTFRDLMIKLRKEYFAKRILMIDVNDYYKDTIKSFVSPKTIMSEMDYVSTNGSKMTVFFLKLSIIRQMKMPS